jgi:hypothetical protein
MASRLMYEMFKGPAPAGYKVVSTCCYPDCLLPAHLKLVRNGIPAPVRESVIAMRERGMPDKEIARRTGLAPKQVYQCR